MNLESLYRQEWRRVLATTLRLTGDFDLSEEAVQDAFVAALEQWPRDGAPISPYAWLVSTARNRVVDQLRRRARFLEKQAEIERLWPRWSNPKSICRIVLPWWTTNCV